MNEYSIQTTREDYIIAWFTALAVTIHIFEAALPSPIIGVKPGLANIVTIVILCLFGLRIAIWVSLLRVLTVSLLLGTFLSPTFMLSFGGAIASITILVIIRYFKLNCSALGYSVIAALAHISAQFWLAYYLFIPHQGLLNLLPIFMTVALLTGIVNGMIALKILNNYKN
jgi:heptaprenyl diphosphate synthase